MSEDEVRNVFNGKLDTRNIESRRLNPYGNGIGLSFCKEICQILEGDIKVNSVLSEGSQFTFSMRVKPVYTPEFESESYSDSGATGSQVQHTGPCGFDAEFKYDDTLVEDDLNPVQSQRQTRVIQFQGVNFDPNASLTTPIEVL